MNPTLLCACPLPPNVIGRARADFGAIVSQDRVLSPEEIVGVLAGQPGIRAIVISSRNRFAAGNIAKLPDSVGIIATCSVGFEHVDVAAARARGIVVTNTPDVLNDATADLAMMLIMCAARRAREYIGIMESGWREPLGLGDLLGTDVGGKTLGIVGLGRIGRALAQRARAFGMRIAYYNRSRLSPDLEQGAAYCASLRELLPRSQVLSLHAPGGAETTNCIDAAALALLPRGAILVNTARGQLVDEDALVEALTSGQVGAAGLDVFRSEPDYDLRLRDLPNVFLTPHMGSATVETRDAMGYRALDNVAAFIAGRRVGDPL